MKNKKRRGNADFRVKDMFPMSFNEDVSNYFLNLIKRFDFSQFSFQRHRIFSFKMIFVLLVNSIVSSAFSINYASSAFTGKSILGVCIPCFSKQALFKKLALIDPDWFKKLLLFFVNNLPVINNKINVSKHKLRQFKNIYKFDGCTLDPARNKVSVSHTNLYDKLGGIIIACTNLLNEKLEHIHFHHEASRNDIFFFDVICSWIKKDCLYCFDKGYNKYGLFNYFIQKKAFFIIPLHKANYFSVVKVMYRDKFISDSIISLGKNSNSVDSYLRLVSIKVDNDYFSYITNVTDPSLLSPADIYYLYERRWNIEKSFNYLKRTLGLSYLWSSNKNITEIQLYVSLIVYSVMVSLIGDLSVALDTVPDDISFHMVKKAFFKYSQVYDDSSGSLFDFLVSNFKTLKLIKPVRLYQTRKKELLHDIFSNYIT